MAANSSPLGRRNRRALYARNIAAEHSHKLPALYVDHDLPGAYRDLIDGRATLVELADAEAVIAGAAKPWDADAVAGTPVRVVSRVGVGYDNVDVAGLARVGVAACNAPVAPSVSTAEHTVALIFAITKHLPRQVARSRAGELGEPVGRTLELDGATLGLVGYGRIAQRVATVMSAVGMSVIAFDPYATGDATVQLVELGTLLENADVLSLHAPATEETHHLIDGDAIATMKPGAYLVNAARGGLVDTQALLTALESGHLAGAGLDVTDPEPLPVDHPLLGRDDVIVTPHVASSTIAGRRRLYEHAIEHALAFLAGDPRCVISP